MIPMDEIKNHLMGNTCCYDDLVVSWDFKQDFYLVDCKCGEQWKMPIQKPGEDSGANSMLFRIGRWVVVDELTPKTKEAALKE
jgi:hypothetical protein